MCSKDKPKIPASLPMVEIAWAKGFAQKAQHFASTNALPIIKHLNNGRGLCFYLDASGWSLVDVSTASNVHFQMSFEQQQVLSTNDPLCKAIGKAQNILDMTAGWGVDALRIAQLGKSVLSLENNPVVIICLQQARISLGHSLASRLQFMQADATKIDLMTLEQHRLSPFDLVYIDPMFAGKPIKSAKSKKSLQILQRLASPSTKEQEARLLENALSLAAWRVVVKRARKAPYLAGKVPQGSIDSKLLRFDLYAPCKN